MGNLPGSEQVAQGADSVQSQEGRQPDWVAVCVGDHRSSVKFMSATT